MHSWFIDDLTRRKTIRRLSKIYLRTAIRNTDSISISRFIKFIEILFQMPVCSYFLLGECTKDDCPYRHVNVSEDADVCQDFLKGYCALDDKVCILEGLF